MAVVPLIISKSKTFSDFKDLKISSKIEQMVNESLYIHNILIGILGDPTFW